VDRIGDTVRQELRRFGGSGAMPDVVDAWPGLVGEHVAANAWPARIARDGTLHVNASSSAWAFELGHLEGEILPRLQEALGTSAPVCGPGAKGYSWQVFRPGPLDAPAPGWNAPP